MPWPIRLGPLPRMITAGLLARRAPRSPRRRTSSGTASWRRTRRRRCRRSCRPAGCRARAARRGRRRRVIPRILPICRSEKPCRLASRSSSGVSSAAAVDLGGDLVDQQQLVDEPGVDRGGLEDLLGRGAGADRVHHVLEPAVVRDAGLLEQRLLVELHPLLVPVERRVLALQGAQRLLQRLGEVAADRHRLADRLHVGGQRGVGGRELLEREPRHLHHDVVERRLEAGRRALPSGGDVVGDLVEGVADRDLGRDLGDREPGRLRRQRAGARDPRVHLDDDDAAVARVDGELDVAAAGVHADRADDADREVAQVLVLAVGERHRRRHGDRVAGVHAHRVEVLDRADDHHVVLGVAHDLELVLLPADDRLLEEHLGGRARGQAGAGDPAQVRPRRTPSPSRRRPS